MFLLIVLFLLFSRRREWGGYGRPYGYGYGRYGYGYGSYGYGGGYGYPYGAYTAYNPYFHHRQPSYGGYRPYGYW